MKAQTLRRVRQIHHYIGVFFTPAILLFALSGALQTFRLHEDAGYGGTPPGWIVWMAAVHKDQALPHAKAAKGEAAAHDEDHDHGDDHEHGDGADHDHDHADAAPMAGKVQGTVPDAAKAQQKEARAARALPLKIFVVLVAIGLILSSLLGVVIALTNRATRRVSVVMLVAGTALPLLLLLG